MRLVGPGRAGKGVSELSGNRKQDYPLQNKHIFLDKYNSARMLLQIINNEWQLKSKILIKFISPLTNLKCYS